MNNKTIKFFHVKEGMDVRAPCPEPAKSIVPGWYKKLDKYINNNNKLHIAENGSTNAGVKACISFLDALTVGYIVKLHCDILVKRDGEKFDMSWTSPEPPLSSRSSEIANQLPVLPGFSAFTQAWELKYGFIVPKGYSVLVTQPFNRFDLPTFVTSGIIDADEPISGGGAPFAVANNFEGIIPQGTPIAQLIPFKRESWKSEKMPLRKDYEFMTMRARDRITGWYRDEIWKKKNYD